MWLFFAILSSIFAALAAVDKCSSVITMVLAFALLHETSSIKAVLGCILIAGGTLLMVL